MAPEDAGVQEQPQEPLVRTDHRGIDSPAGAATNAGQREDLQAYLEGLDEFMAGLEETPPPTGSGANPQMDCLIRVYLPKHGCFAFFLVRE